MIINGVLSKKVMRVVNVLADIQTCHSPTQVRSITTSANLPSPSYLLL